MLYDVERNSLLMDHEKPMKIVLLEDDVSACREFIECANSRTDIVFVGMTASSYEALEFVKNKLPEAVIVDLELSWGKGNGYHFLDEFQKLDLSIRPIVVVTTQNRSLDIQKQIHVEYAVDHIFSKFQEDYNVEMVINLLFKFRSFLSKRSGGNNPGLQTLETPEEIQNRIKQRINAELDAFGINVKYKGREIAEEAIYLLLNKNKKDTETIFQELARKRGTHYNNIVRPLQTAINDAWDNTDDIDALMKHYTAPVRNETGGPSPTEFIFYYAGKIRREM